MAKGKALAVLLCATVAIADDMPAPWIGVSMGVEGAVPEVDGRAFARGVRVQEVVPGSPAEKGGLRAGDVIVAMTGVDFERDAEGLLARFREAVTTRQVGDTIDLQVVRDSVARGATIDGNAIDDPAAWADPDAFLAKSPPGSRLDLSAVRRREVLPLRVTLEARPVHVSQSRVPPNAEILPEGVPAPPEEAFAAALRQDLGVEADYQDLLARLARLHEQADPCRLRRFAYAHRDPFKVVPLSRRAVKDLAHAGSALPVAAGAAWLDRPVSGETTPLAPPGRTLDERVDEIVALLGRAKGHWDRAFAATTREERDFAIRQLPSLSDAFIATHVIQDDEKRDRAAANLDLVKVAARIEFAELFAAAAEVGEVLAAAEDRLRPDLERAWEEKGRPSDVFLSKDTPYGKVLIGGKGRTWYREDAAVIIDLGGDDFYTNNAGASAGDHLPFAIVIDYSGNDAYEATFDWAQGAGRLGVGALLDCEGDDAYVGQRWAQGACAMGVGALLDRGGRDTFRGSDYVQAAALWGQAWLVDGARTAGSDDRYEAAARSQSCAMPGGLSVLHDGRGDDRYYCKGLHATNYGDAGIFDAWGQGCGFGFRGLLSGGLALLVDDEGDDAYEAGNFSQGGGYYFGWGVLVDASGEDRYVGSRYNQGFAAHEAMGFLEDARGNDRYDTRQGVAQGLSWDETVVAFLDDEGDDEYRGGGFFSQGAVAHNGFCLFEDGGGKDAYDYPPGQADAGQNDYHGGTSFALFLDLGGAEDVYNSDTRNGEVRAKGSHGLVCDLPGPIDIEAARRLIRK